MPRFLTATTRGMQVPFAEMQETEEEQGSESLVTTNLECSFDMSQE